MKRFNPACVLVVDDHADTVSLIDRLLTSRGYDVLSATSAAQASRILASIKCDALVADIGLPDGSGLDLMRRVAAAGYGTRGIAVSGRSSDADREAAGHAGFERFLSKPVDFNLLVAHVRELRSPSITAPAPAEAPAGCA